MGWIEVGIFIGLFALWYVAVCNLGIVGRPIGSGCPTCGGTLLAHARYPTILHCWTCGFECPRDDAAPPR